MTANEMWKKLAPIIHPDRYEGKNKEKMEELTKRINAARDDNNIDLLQKYYDRYTKIQSKRNMGKQPKREKQLDYSMVPPDADDFVVKNKDSVKEKDLQREEEKFIQKTRSTIGQIKAMKEIESRLEEKLKISSLTESQKQYLASTQTEFTKKINEIFEAFKMDIHDAFSGKAKDPEAVKNECAEILIKNIENLITNCNDNLEEFDTKREATKEKEEIHEKIEGETKEEIATELDKKINKEDSFEDVKYKNTVELYDDIAKWNIESNNRFSLENRAAVNLVEYILWHYLNPNEHNAVERHYDRLKEIHKDISEKMKSIESENRSEDILIVDNEEKIKVS